MKTRNLWLATGLGGVFVLLILLLGLAGSTRSVVAAPLEQSSGYITVTARSGDSLVVYKRVFGVSASSIIAVNKFKDPNLIYIGQVVTIPVVKSYVPSLTTPFYYVVQPNDQLFELAMRFEMDPSFISYANKLQDNTLVVGSTILIPAGPHWHIAKKGETIKIIAAFYGVTVQHVLSGNTIPNPDLIFEGQGIIIPIVYNAQPVPLTGASGVVATATNVRSVTSTPTRPASSNATATAVSNRTPTAVPTLAIAGNYIQVTVQSGDSYLKYTTRYGVSAWKLRLANPHIKDPNLIFPGQTVVIPVIASYTPSRTTPFFYVMKQGETVDTLALRFEMATSTLTETNPYANFAAGTTVLIPPGPHVYVARQGDTLASIAGKFGTTTDVLLGYNTFANPSQIPAGRQIYIPFEYDKSPLPFD